MTSLGFGNTLEKTLNKLDKVLLNEGLLKVCGDAGWDKGDFNNDRVALAREGIFDYFYAYELLCRLKRFLKAFKLTGFKLE